MDESGGVRAKEPNRKDKYLAKRTKKLAEFGIHGSTSKSMLDSMTERKISELAVEMGRRGIMSLESTLLKDSRDRYNRAKQLGYEGVEDRYDSDTQFCDRIHQEGKDVSNCIFDDMFAFAHLPDPPRTRQQFVAGVAANAVNEHALTKLMYIKNPTQRPAWVSSRVPPGLDQTMGIHLWPKSVHAAGLRAVPGEERRLPTAADLARCGPSSS